MEEILFHKTHIKIICEERDSNLRSDLIRLRNAKEEKYNGREQTPIFNSR